MYFSVYENLLKCDCVYAKILIEKVYLKIFNNVPNDWNGIEDLENKINKKLNIEKLETYHQVLNLLFNSECVYGFTTLVVKWNLGIIKREEFNQFIRRTFIINKINNKIYYSDVDLLETVVTYFYECIMDCYNINENIIKSYFLNLMDSYKIYYDSTKIRPLYIRKDSKESEEYLNHCLYDLSENDINFAKTVYKVSDDFQEFKESFNEIKDDIVNFNLCVGSIYPQEYSFKKFVEMCHPLFNNEPIDEILNRIASYMYSKKLIKAVKDV